MKDVAALLIHMLNSQWLVAKNALVLKGMNESILNIKYGSWK